MPGLWLPPGVVHPRNFVDHAKNALTITASGTANTKGTWTQVIASTAFDYYGFWTYTDSMGVTNTSTGGLLDFGYGPAGGADPGSDVNLIENWDAGWSGTDGANKPHFPRQQYWPIFVPAGSKIWTRLAAQIASDTCRVRFVGQKSPSLPGMPLVPRALAIGAVTASSRGTVVTSGAGVYGTAVSLGTTTRDHRLWAIGIDGGTDTSLANIGGFHARLQIGSGSSAIIGEWLFNTDTTTEMVGGPWPPVPVYSPVPSGTEIFASLDANGTGDSLAFIAYGM